MTSTSAEHSSWTAPGSNQAAQATYASVKTALKDVIASRSIEVFLQGSYANATNIRADSDVDIVVMTRLTFRGVVERLSPAGRQRYDALSPSSFQANDLRSEVTQALNAYYGATHVHPKNKCIRVDGGQGRVDADVVPCIQYRWYHTPGSDLGSEYVEGIAIQPVNGSVIINFPKEHISRGQAKNVACNQRFKPTVRQLKRLRNRAVDEGRIQKDIAPGYPLECMVSNALNALFVADDSARLRDIIWWLKQANKSLFLSADGIHGLFMNDPGSFDVATAQRILDALWEAY